MIAGLEEVTSGNISIGEISASAGMRDGLRGLRSKRLVNRAEQRLTDAQIDEKTHAREHDGHRDRKGERQPKSDRQPVQPLSRRR